MSDDAPQQRGGRPSTRHFMPAPLRPVWLCAWRMLCTLAALLCLALPATTLSAADAHGLENLAPGVWVLVGDVSDASPTNLAEVGNVGFIAGDSGVLVVGAGGRFIHGERILASARRISAKPVVGVVITQALQEFLMGSAAFAAQGIPLIAHDATAELIAARCDQCERQLRSLLGDAVMQGTRVIVPDQRLHGPREIDLGGRVVSLLTPGWGASPGDVAVWDSHSRTLFGGALVTNRRIPALRDARLQSWLDVLQTLAALGPEHVVPGYGPPGNAGLLDATAGYLQRLQAQVRQQLEAGAGLSDTIKLPAPADYRDWALHPAAHKRNLQYEYLHQEAEAFGR